MVASRPPQPFAAAAQTDPLSPPLFAHCSPHTSVLHLRLHLTITITSTSTSTSTSAPTSRRHLELYFEPGDRRLDWPRPPVEFSLAFRHHDRPWYHVGVDRLRHHSGDDRVLHRGGLPVNDVRVQHSHHGLRGHQQVGRGELGRAHHHHHHEGRGHTTLTVRPSP